MGMFFLRKFRFQISKWVGYPVNLISNLDQKCLSFLLTPLFLILSVEIIKDKNGVDPGRISVQVDIEVLIYVTKIRIEIWYSAGYPVPSQFQEHFCILYHSVSNIVCGGAAEDQNDVDQSRLTLRLSCSFKTLQSRFKSKYDQFLQPLTIIKKFISGYQFVSASMNTVCPRSRVHSHIVEILLKLGNAQLKYRNMNQYVDISFQQQIPAILTFYGYVHSYDHSPLNTINGDMYIL